MPPSQYVDSYDDDGLDDDYDDDYAEGEEGLSPEDEAAMAEGTAKVRKALGKDSSKVNLKQIQDALWNYYYDVDKSVAYLNKTFIEPPPAKAAPKAPAPKKTPEGMSRSISFSDIHPSMVPYGAEPQLLAGEHGDVSFGASPTFPILTRPHLPIQSCFDDMPWLNTPQDRQSTFIAPWRPRGGLLGGSEGGGGMSKLQKLAAARKKKNEEKKGQEKPGAAETGIGKLSLSDQPAERPEKRVHPLAKRQRTSAQTDTSSQKQLVTSQKPPSPPSHQEPQEALPSSTKTAPDASGEEEDGTDTVKTAPSAFAQTLFGSAPDSHKPRRDVFPMPYTSSSAFSTKTFSEPSPDDIVFAAQSKGSNFARAK